jgi:hypothetical protein
MRLAEKLDWKGLNCDTVKVQNHFHKDSNSKPHSENTFYHSVETLFSSQLLYKYVNIKIYKL